MRLNIRRRLKQRYVRRSLGRQSYSAWLVVILSILTLSGCVQTGAPAFTLLGSFIPYWMVCAAAGLAVAIIVRLIFIKVGIDDLLPFRLAVYLCLMLSVSFISALLFFMG